MIPLEEYYSSSSIQEDLGRLSDPKLDFERDRDSVNRLVLNFVIKYLVSYLRIQETEVRKIRQEVAAILEWKEEMVFRMVPAHGIQYDAIYGGPRPGNDKYPIRCAADVRQTAAIFKEVAFAETAGSCEDYVGLELGSGTGILMAGMAIAARRKNAKGIFLVGIESSGKAAERSQETLGKVLGSGVASVLCKDVVEERLQSKLFQNPIRQWVSETISLNTPKLDLDSPEFGLTPLQIWTRRLEKSGDPFVEGLRNSLRELPDFRRNVESGKAAMFPDPINGSYRPDEGRSTLLLRTSKSKEHKILERASEEFEDYEGLGKYVVDKRWNSAEEVNRMGGVRIVALPVPKDESLGYK